MKLRAVALFLLMATRAQGSELDSSLQALWSGELGSEFLYSEAMAFLQVVMIDLVLAGDNAIVVGMAAAILRGQGPRAGTDLHHLDRQDPARFGP